MTEAFAGHGVATRPWEVLAKHALTPALFICPLAVLMVARPLFYGVTLQATLRFWGFLLLYLLAPGMLFYRIFASDQADWLLLLGMGWTFGLALEMVAYIGLKALGAASLFMLYPLTSIPLAAWVFGRHPGSTRAKPADSPSAKHSLALLAVVALTLEMQPLFSSHLSQEYVPLDLLFHTGNAAELLHHWPLRDPRIAGVPLNYHYFAYAFPAGASQVTGIPVSTLMARLTPLVEVVLVTIQVYNAGRAILRDQLAGLLGSIVFMLHTDIGRELAPRLGHFNSYLEVGIYSSTTTVEGFIFLAALAIVLQKWFTSQSRFLPQALLLGLLSFVTAGVKALVMPVVLLGLAAVAAWRFALQRRPAHRLLGALLITGLASTPMTLAIAWGAGTWSSMFHFAPGAVVYTSAFYRQVASLMGLSGAQPMWLDALLTIVWLVGYLGLAGVGALIYFLRHKGKFSDIESWGVMLFLSGLALAYLTAAPGFSQLFFLYNGQLILAVLSGAAMTSLMHSSSARNKAWAGLLVLFALPMLLHAARTVKDRLQRDWLRAHAADGLLVSDYLAGMAWLREQAPPQAVILANHNTIIVSAYGERRTFYETGFYTPQAHPDWQEAREPFPERVALLTRFFLGPDAQTLRALVQDYPAVYVVVDHVRVLPRDGTLLLAIGPVRENSFTLPQGWASLEFANRALQIYQLHLPMPSHDS